MHVGVVAYSKSIWKQRRILWIFFSSLCLCVTFEPGRGIRVLFTVVCGHSLPTCGIPAERNILYDQIPGCDSSRRCGAATEQGIFIVSHPRRRYSNFRETRLPAQSAAACCALVIWPARRCCLPDRWDADDNQGWGWASCGHEDIVFVRVLRLRIGRTARVNGLRTD